ncbi:hypothetical protein DRE_00991 [Drechslerella stenobrocha 248]|uniref:Uncharacterized protein n=1 Tax=Drechslerella stenobrocha 248 TaxID=1043628 RepID=W7HXQ5_9PEZI|nr:hypothetical protein DRE_00991 [Drechslerella stenobrocha 248]
MSYRDGGGYGHGGYHSELPPTQLGDISIDPEEFPNVAQHLQHFHLGSHSAASVTGSAGYLEDGARHLFVGPDGSHYYTNEVPGTAAPYTGYNYIQAPESATAPAPHAFAGALRGPPADASFHGMGYFDAWSTYPYSTNMGYPAQQKRYTLPAADATAAGTPYARMFPHAAITAGAPTPTPQSAQSAFPPPNPLSLPPPPSPAISSSTASSKARPEKPFAPIKRFSYDDGHSTNLHDRIRNTYEHFMQGYEARDRYDPPSEGYPLHDPDGLRGRRQPVGYYKPSGEYVVPAGNPPRTATKTPSHAETGPSRRTITAAAIHQSRPPNSRHSSSDNGDAEPSYRQSTRYDNPDYTNPPRPKVTKSRPNSFSYNRNDPRPIDSDPSFRAYSLGLAHESASTPFVDPRSSTGSLGAVGIRYGTPAAIIHQGGGYYRDTYGDGRGPTGGGGAIVHSANSRQGRTYNYNPQRSQPINDPGYTYYQAPEDRSDFDERRRRHGSRGRYRAQTPAPDDHAVSEDDRVYRITAKSRPSSPSPPRRAKSRRRHSPSPARYRSKSRRRSKSRPRPEIIQTRTGRGDTPDRVGTPSSNRPKTPIPESAIASRDPDEALRLKEIDRELDRIERERRERERFERQEREIAERQEREHFEKQEREKAERQERERFERQEREKAERQEREKVERQERERQERERQEQERYNRQEREKAEQQERERFEKQEREKFERQEREREKFERQEREREKFERQEREREKAERQEKEKFERQAREKYERQERENYERQEQERLDKLERERIESLGRRARVEDDPEDAENELRRRRHRSRHRGGFDYEARSASSGPAERDPDKDVDRQKEKERGSDRKREKERERERPREREWEWERDQYRERPRDEPQSRSEASNVTDPALANPMVENLNPKRERAGIQPGQVFIRPDLLCAMRALKLCEAEEDPSGGPAHNRLLRLDCGHGFHEGCLRSTKESL